MLKSYQFLFLKFKSTVNYLKINHFFTNKLLFIFLTPDFIQVALKLILSFTLYKILIFTYTTLFYYSILILFLDKFVFQHHFDLFKSLNQTLNSIR
jgi:hypothetical protein